MVSSSAALSDLWFGVTHSFATKQLVWNGVLKFIALLIKLI